MQTVPSLLKAFTAGFSVVGESICGKRYQYLKGQVDRNAHLQLLHARPRSGSSRCFSPNSTSNGITSCVLGREMLHFAPSHASHENRVSGCRARPASTALLPTRP